MSSVVQRALALMECFDEQKPSLSLQEIASRADLPKPTAFRLLATLGEAGYVIQLPNQEYTLSHKLMRLASIAQRTFTIRDVVRPLMQTIREDTGETVDLSVLIGNNRVCIDVLESPNPLKSIINPGETLPLTSGASGKVLLSFQAADIIEKVVKGLDGSVKAKVLRTELRKVRAQGYAFTCGERIQGAAAISVPLRDHLGRVQNCLTLTGPSFRLLPRKSEFISTMLKAGRTISLQLGAPETANSSSAA